MLRTHGVMDAAGLLSMLVGKYKIGGRNFSACRCSKVKLFIAKVVPAVALVEC